MGKCRKIRLQLRVSSAQTNRRNLSKRCKISSKNYGARRVLLLIVTRLSSTVCQTLPRRSTVYFGFLQTSQPLICRNTLSLPRSRVLSQPETLALAQRWYASNTGRAPRLSTPHLTICHNLDAGERKRVCHEQPTYDLSCGIERIEYLKDRSKLSACSYLRYNNIQITQMQHYRSIE